MQERYGQIGLGGGGLVGSVVNFPWVMWPVGRGCHWGGGLFCGCGGIHNDGDVPEPGWMEGVGAV